MSTVFSLVGAGGRRGWWLSRYLGEAADAARGAQVAGGNLGDAVEPGISFGMYNDETEVDAFLEAMRKIVG